MAKPPANAPLQPQNLDAEESVLGAMMLSPLAIDSASNLLATSDFYRPSHGAIFSHAVALHLEGEPVDAITVANALEAAGKLEAVGGSTRIQEIAALVPATTNVAHYASIVREKAVLRGLIAVGEKVSRLGWEAAAAGPDLVEQASALVYELARGSAGDFLTLAETVPPTFQRLEDLYESGATLTGLPTGFAEFDSYTSGLQPGNLIVVAGRPSMGKTALALSILANVIRRAEPAALFSFEMSRTEVTQRFLAMEAFTDLHKVRSGRLDPAGWTAVSGAAGKLSTAPLYISDATSTSLLDLRAKARRLKTRRPDLALIVVDYLQQMSGPGENRVQEVSAITRGLKILAGDLEIPIIAVSQLSRAVESRHDRRPVLADLRESGSIEQDADVVALLYRDEYYNPEDAEELGTAGIAELDIAKQRNGPTGRLKLAFVKRYARFSDLARPGAGDPR